jgi:prevent-host-death family protein
MLNEITAGEARKEFSTLLSQVAFGRMRFSITRHSTPHAVMISPDEFNLFELLLDRFGDQIDSEEIPAVMEEAEREGAVPFEELAEELGI